MKYLHLFVLLCGKFVFAREAANVCKTFFDYYTDRDRNPNCYHNPDMYLSVPEIIQRYGYPVENYTVTTKDKYILTVFRIPHGRNSRNQQNGPPVFLQHGLGISSMAFVNIGRKSLAFTLADNGYDVWMGNFRGTTYSNKHEVLNTNDKQYWNFSFHELGIYDLRAQLDLVVEKTQQKLFYIGFSKGTTAYYVYNSEYPNIAQQRIRIAISLAPIAFVHHIETPLKIFVPQWNAIEAILKHTTNGDLNQRTPEKIAEKEARCLPDPIKITTCLTFANLLYGLDLSQQDMETLPITTIQDYDAFSVKTVTHYTQMVQSKQFQKFDYGNANKEVYGSSLPPLYNLSEINVPNYFIRANKDPLATRKNVEETYAALSKHVKPFDMFLIPYDDFNHADFVIAKDVKQLLYDHIVKFLKTNEKTYR